MTDIGQPNTDEPSQNGTSPVGESTGQTDRTPELEEVVARVDALSKQIGDLRETLAAERERRVELEGELEDERSRRRALEEEVEGLNARTDLLRLVESSDQSTGEQRSITLVQHLHRQPRESWIGDVKRRPP